MKQRTTLPHFLCSKRALVLGLGLSGVAFSAGALTTVYTDQGLFRTAAGGTPDVIEDFNAVTPGPLSNFAGGAFTLSQTGDGIAAIVLDPGSNADVNGTVFLNTSLNTSLSVGTDDDTITFSFDSPVTAVGFELNPFIADAGNGVLFTTNQASESGSYLLPSELGGFRGFVFTSPVNSFTITADPDDVFAFHGIDNVELFIVPEPTSLAAIGFLGAIGLCRRRKMSP